MFARFGGSSMTPMNGNGPIVGRCRSFSAQQLNLNVQIRNRRQTADTYRKTPSHLVYLEPDCEGASLRKSYLIKKEAEFQNVFDHGDSVANRNFVIYHMKRDQPHFRVGISVGKKVGHTAVMRNQIKRYIRQSLLELKPNIDAQTDFLVIARKSANQLDMAGTKKNLIHVMRLAGILNEDIEVI